MVNNVQAVFFDMDGTLIDSEQYWIQLFESIVAKHGKVLAIEDRNALFGCSHELEIKVMSKYFGNNEALILQEKHTYMDEHPFEYKKYLKEGVRELIEYLYSKNIQLAVTSSSYTKNIQDMLRECELEQYFAFIVSADMVSHEKPDPEIYQRAQEISGLPSENIYVIEDSIPGVLATQAAGLEVILIENDLYSVDVEGIHLKFKSHYEIMEYMSGLLGGK